MKILNLILTFLPIISTLFLFASFSTTAFSENHNRFGLPAGAKARIGKGEIHQLKYFPDSKRIAVATSIGIWIYDSLTGEALDLLTGHTAPVLSMALSHDGETLATGSEDGTIQLWNTNTSELRTTYIGHKGSVVKVVFSPSGKMLASCTERRQVNIWDTQNAKIIHTILSDAEPISEVTFFPDEEMVLTLGKNDSYQFIIEYWNAQTGDHIKDDLIEENFTAIAISPDCKTLACSGDSPLQFWDIENTKRLSIDTETEGDYDYLAFSTDGESLVAAERWEYLSLWSVSPMQLMKNFTHDEAFNSIAYSPDGKTVASGTKNGSVKIWDVSTGKRIQTISGHNSEKIYTAAFQPDSAIITIGTKSEIQLWNVQTGDLVKTVPEPRYNVYSVKYSDDNQLIATGGESKKARLWDAQTGRFLGSFVGHENYIYSVDISPDSRILATAGGYNRRRPEVKERFNRDNSVCLWEIRLGEIYLIGERLANFTEHTDWVNTVEFSPDGQTLASCSQDKTIQLWDVNTRTHLRTLTGHEDGVSDIVYSPDGKTLASGSLDETIRLWNPNTGDVLLTLVEGVGPVTAMAYSPDGSLLASSTKNNNAIHLWDAKGGGQLHTFIGHTNLINEVAFSTDGKTLVSVSSDCTVLIWNIKDIIPN